MVNGKGQEPASRGIPSKKAMLFIYDKLPMSLGARWDPEHVIELFFPALLQKAQHDIAVKLITFLAEAGEANGDQISAWQKREGIPNSTLRNLVIPKLVRVGMLARERRNPTGQDSKDKRHQMVLKLSTRFGEALRHIGREWSSLVETWKIKREKPAN